MPISQGKVNKKAKRNTKTNFVVLLRKNRNGPRAVSYRGVQRMWHGLEVEEKQFKKKRNND